MNKLLIESQYFGTLNYIITLFQYSNIEIESCESYQKLSFRNRCMVAGANGVVSLSVPLEKGRGNRELMKDVRISYTGRWQSEHMRAITSCYARSPYYEYYADRIEQLVMSRHAFLLDKNMAILEWLAEVYGFGGTMGLTADYVAHPPQDRVTDMRNHILPRNYQSWPSPVYYQVFQERTGFLPNLSILDILCCNGPSLNIV